MTDEFFGYRPELDKQLHDINGKKIEIGNRVNYYATKFNNAKAKPMVEDKRVMLITVDYNNKVWVHVDTLGSVEASFCEVIK